jgi:hypothetical protein
MGVGGQLHNPAVNSVERTPLPVVQRLGWLHGRSERVLHVAIYRLTARSDITTDCTIPAP